MLFVSRELLLSQQELDKKNKHCVCHMRQEATLYSLCSELLGKVAQSCQILALGHFISLDLI